MPRPKGRLSRQVNNCTLPNPITSVIQEVNGLKRKITAPSLIQKKKSKQSLQYSNSGIANHANSTTVEATPASTVVPDKVPHTSQALQHLTQNEDKPLKFKEVQNIKQMITTWKPPLRKQDQAGLSMQEIQKPKATVKTCKQENTRVQKSELTKSSSTSSGLETPKDEQRHSPSDVETTISSKTIPSSRHTANPKPDASTVNHKIAKIPKARITSITQNEFPSQLNRSQAKFVTNYTDDESIIGDSQQDIKMCTNSSIKIETSQNNAIVIDLHSSQIKEPNYTEGEEYTNTEIYINSKLDESNELQSVGYSTPRNTSMCTPTNISNLQDMTPLTIKRRQHNESYYSVDESCSVNENKYCEEEFPTDECDLTGDQFVTPPIKRKLPKFEESPTLFSDIGSDEDFQVPTQKRGSLAGGNKSPSSPNLDFYEEEPKDDVQFNHDKDYFKLAVKPTIPCNNGNKSPLVVELYARNDIKEIQYVNEKQPFSHRNTQRFTLNDGGQTSENENNEEIMSIKILPTVENKILPSKVTDNKVLSLNVIKSSQEVINKCDCKGQDEYFNVEDKQINIQVDTKLHTSITANLVTPIPMNSNILGLHENNGTSQESQNKIGNAITTENQEYMLPINNASQKSENYLNSGLTQSKNINYISPVTNANLKSQNESNNACTRSQNLLAYNSSSPNNSCENVYNCTPSQIIKEYTYIANNTTQISKNVSDIGVPYKDMLLQQTAVLQVKEASEEKITSQKSQNRSSNTCIPSKNVHEHVPSANNSSQTSQNGLDNSLELNNDVKHHVGALSPHYSNASQKSQNGLKSTCTPSKNIKEHVPSANNASQTFQNGPGNILALKNDITQYTNSLTPHYNTYASQKSQNGTANTCRDLPNKNIEEKEHILLTNDTSQKSHNGTANTCIDIPSKNIKEKEHISHTKNTSQTSKNEPDKVCETNNDIKENREPYLYEMDQDCDLFSSSQLLAIEDELKQEMLQELVHKGGNHPNECKIAPQNVPVTCGEARVPVFRVPTMPPFQPFDWTQKARDDRQKLRGIVQEMSKLNAMITKVRREMWPGKRQDYGSSSSTIFSPPQGGPSTSNVARPPGTWGRGHSRY